MQFTATYSPEDNKIRISASSRLDPDLYARVRGAGFIWAPKQEIFVAPMWTPGRADLAEELAGEIGDEDTSLAERAEERAERFEDYSDNRASDAESARLAVAAIADNIPFGQPILVGHHSERHARRDAAKIENGMRRAVKMWETSEYWTRRAAGAIAHAKYKERPDVRARRIKGIEADKRKQEKIRAEAEKWLKLWDNKGVALTIEQARLFANYCQLTVTRTNADGTPNNNGGWSAYDVLRPAEERYKACPSATIEDCQNAARKAYPRTIEHCGRWIDHYDNRLAYERAMLNESGGTVADQIGPEIGGAITGLCSPRGGWAYIVKVNKVTVTVRHQWSDGGRVFNHNEPKDKIRAIMTKAQVDAARAEGRIKEADNGVGFWLMQSREEFDAAEAKSEPAKVIEEAKPLAEEIQAMKQTIKAGIQVVTAPQLFPTPKGLAQRVADLADIQPGHRVLEPSAGTGMLLGAIGGRMFGHNPERGAVHAIEINPALAGRLQTEFPLTEVHCNDFLENVPDDFEPFDRILMNPPFSNGSDIAHIKHAMQMLNAGGKLVAICANGPRQRETLKPLAAYWEDLPAGTFAEQGTGVNTALLVIEQVQQ